MRKVVRHGTCDWCLNDDLDIFNFDGEEMCLECDHEQYTKCQLKASELESCMKHEAEEWLPEHEEEDDD